MHPSYEQIYEAVRRIPRGRVATYGQIAALAGLPGHARQVGYALHSLPEKSGVPWQRVINSRGEVSTRATLDAENLQRALLEQEGIVFGADGRLELRRFQWRPEVPVAKAGGKKTRKPATEKKGARVSAAGKKSAGSRAGGNKTARKRAGDRKPAARKSPARRGSR